MIVAKLIAAALFASATTASAQEPGEPVEVSDPFEPAGPSAGAFSVGGSFTLASQYRFRGISQSDEDPAFQGTLTVSHDSGAYAGLFASTLKGYGKLGGADVELDLYAGYGTRIASGVSLDAGLLYYAYPGSSGGDFEFFEPYASLSGTLGPATAKVGVAYAWEQDALAGNSNLYLLGDLSAGIPNTRFSLKSHLGHSRGDTPLSPGGDYFDWMLGADYTTRGLTLGLFYVDTDLTGRQARLVGATRDIVDSAVLLTLTTTF